MAKPDKSTRQFLEIHREAEFGKLYVDTPNGVACDEKSGKVSASDDGNRSGSLQQSKYNWSGNQSGE